MEQTQLKLAEGNYKEIKMSIKAERIVDKILNNLLDRCGIGNEIEACDDEVRQEMREDLIKIADKELENNEPDIDEMGLRLGIEK